MQPLKSDNGLLGQVEEVPSNSPSEETCALQDPLQRLDLVSPVTALKLTHVYRLSTRRT